MGGGYIFTDLDGTLLNSNHRPSEKTRLAYRRACKAGWIVIPATGRPFSSAQSLNRDVPPGEEGWFEHYPGVYLQGLVVFGRQKEIIYECVLPTELVNSVMKFAEGHDARNRFGLVAYNRCKPFCLESNAHVNKLTLFGENEAEPLGGSINCFSEISVNKLLFITDTVETRDQIRSEVQLQFNGKVSLTSAISTTLEILPLGASKGKGVEQLLKHLNVQASDIVALGDEENDLEMLKLAGIGIAMGTAPVALRNVATAMTSSNDEEGWARAVNAILDENVNRNNDDYDAVDSKRHPWYVRRLDPPFAGAFPSSAVSQRRSSFDGSCAGSAMKQQSTLGGCVRRRRRWSVAPLAALSECGGGDFRTF